MSPLDPVALWEAAASAPAGGRLAALLRALDVDPAAVTLGAGAHRVLALRAALVGDRIEGYAVCPACGEGHTVLLAHDDLAAAVPDSPDALTVTWQDHCLRVRPPTAQDLAEAGGTGDTAAALATLRHRILLEARRGDDRVAPEALPEDAWAAIDDALEAADELADPQIALVCRACGEDWSLGLDPAGYLTRELGQIARARLAAVAELARAFGWSEAEILGLGDARRRLYLDLARGVAP